MTRAVLGWAVAAVATIATRAAGASPEFPEVIRDDLGISYVPACTLCHTGGGGDAETDASAGPADTPFAMAAIARGLKADDDDSLRAALEAMRKERVDTAGDGESDIDKLIWGTDPNTADVPKGGAPPPPVNYGCAVATRTGPGRASLATTLGALVGAALLLTVQRGRARTGCPGRDRPPARRSRGSRESSRSPPDRRSRRR